MSKVSVIIPNYNHAQFLPKRIESVINQTYGDIEVIILDDCSTDNSQEIIEKYAANDNRIVKHYNTVNTGSPFKQWKKGINLAKGEFVWIAESDDYADVTLLGKLIAAMQQNPDAGVAYCQSNFVNANGVVVGNHLENLSVLHPTMWQSDFCMDGNEVLARFMPIINVIPNVGAALFRRNLVKKIHWDNLFHYKLGGDRYFWIQVLNKEKLCFVAQSLNFFRVHPDTQRNQYLHSITYLNEVKDNIKTICSLVKVSRVSKTKAIRQWLRYFRNSTQNQSKGKLMHYVKSFFIFTSLVTIYLK